MNEAFVPVALKAAMVNNPPPGTEGELYAEIGRSKAAPQGICVANSDGKVLSWVLSFDDDASVVDFLDYCLQRFEETPSGALPVIAQRFMKFPSRPLPDVRDRGQALAIPQSHVAGDRCPAEPMRERGTLVGRIVGRPLDESARPINSTARQEEYMEARFEVPPATQHRFIRALAASAEGESFSVPRELARLLASHAYLGQLDVNPLGGRSIGGEIDRESIDFRAERVRSEGAVQMAYLTGTSRAAGGAADLGLRSDGRRWEHDVHLSWEGYLEVVNDRIRSLVLTAHGTERLRWGNTRWNLIDEPDVAHLMAGHPIDLDCNVRYGLSAPAIPDDRAVSVPTTP